MVEVGSRKSQKRNFGAGLSVTSATTLAFGHCSARLGCLGDFGSACSAVVPFKEHCSATLSPEEDF